MAGDTRHQIRSVSEQVADIVVFTGSLFTVSRHHIAPGQLLIAHYCSHLPTHQPCIVPILIRASLNTPSVIICTMGSKYLPSPV